ncbi:dodecenoyl-CoA isomerase [Saitoella coloradoensis]
MDAEPEAFVVEHHPRTLTTPAIAVIRINRPTRLGALDFALYMRLGSILRKIDARDDIDITVLTGTGKFFSAGADVKSIAARPPPTADPRTHWLSSFSLGNQDLTRAFYTHRHLLIAALNGPAIGLSAALLGCCDLVYAVEGAWLLTPFTNLGLVAEGGASYSFVKRMGVGKATEALLQSKKMGVGELYECGFVNRIFPPQGSSEFMETVLGYVKDSFEGVNMDSVRKTKKLIWTHMERDIERANGMEVQGAVERFTAGIPQREFEKLARKEKRHKL